MGAGLGHPQMVRRQRQPRPLVVFAIADASDARPRPLLGGGPSVPPPGAVPIVLSRTTREPRRPLATLVIEVQFSTSSCSNMPEVPKHIRYAL